MCSPLNNLDQTGDLDSELGARLIRWLDLTLMGLVIFGIKMVWPGHLTATMHYIVP